MKVEAPPAPGEPRHTRSKVWKIQTNIPEWYAEPERVVSLIASGMELDIILRDIEGIPKASSEGVSVKPGVIVRKAFTPQTWYGDDAKYIWCHFLTYYRGI